MLNTSILMYLAGYVKGLPHCRYGNRFCGAMRWAACPAGIEFGFAALRHSQRTSYRKLVTYDIIIQCKSNLAYCLREYIREQKAVQKRGKV